MRKNVPVSNFCFSEAELAFLVDYYFHTISKLFSNSITLDLTCSYNKRSALSGYQRISLLKKLKLNLNKSEHGGYMLYAYTCGAFALSPVFLDLPYRRLPPCSPPSRRLRSRTYLIIGSSKSLQTNYYLHLLYSLLFQYVGDFFLKKKNFQHFQSALITFRSVWISPDIREV